MGAVEAGSRKQKGRRARIRVSLETGLVKVKFQEWRMETKGVEIAKALHG
jgi:hypothetical protein